MTRLSVLVIPGALLFIAGCGGDNTTTFVLQSPTPSPSSAAGSPSGSPSPDSSSLPLTAATPIAGGLKIIIDNPDAGSAISSPVQVLGSASVDNGTVVVAVLDAAGNELGRTTTLASASKPDFGQYSATVSFSGATPGKKGQLKAFGVSPRDGKTPTNYYFITVTFA